MIYNKDYFLNKCEGFEVFKSCGGYVLSKRLKKVFDRVMLYKPKRVLDFGCGRGEFALNLALRGVEVYACDISDDAIDIANELKSRWEFKKGRIPLKIFKIYDENDLLLTDIFFDVCVMNDVIEHIQKERCDLIFKIFKKIIKSNGLLLIHTSPGRIFLEYGLKVYSFIGFLMGFKFNKSLKDMLPPELKPPYHINHWSVGDIKKSLKAAGFKNIGFELWKNPHYAYYFTGSDRFLNAIRMVSSIIPFKELFYSDIFVYAYS